MSKRPRALATESNPPADARPAASGLTRSLPASRTRALEWTALAAALLTLAVFVRSIPHPFVVWDDEANFVNNVNYRGLGLRQLHWMFTTFHEGPYQPLSWITLGLDYLLWGMKAQGYHLTNVLIHAASAGILCALAVRLHARGPLSAAARPAALPASGRAARMDPDTAGPGGVPRAALLFGIAVSLLWSLHPLRVEAVSWVTERREVLCGALSFLTLLHAERGGRWWSVALLALGALLAKGTAVVLAPLLILLDVYLARELEPRALFAIALRSARRHALVIVLAGAFAAVAILGQRETQAMASYEVHGFADRLRFFGNGLGFYVAKTLWPFGIAPMYDPPADRATLTLPALVSVAALIAFVAVTWRLRRSIGHLWTLGVAYFVLLLPVGGLVQVGGQMAADRYSYQPATAITLAIVACVGLWLVPRAMTASTRPVLWIALSVPVAFLSWRSIGLQGIWSDSIALWRHQLAEYPDSPIAHLHLGILSRDGAIAGATSSDAEAHFQRAVRRLPGYSTAWCALGELYARSGRNDEALACYENALRSTPGHRPSLAARADLLWKLQRIPESLTVLRELVGVAPHDVKAHLLYAEALATAGDARAALAQYELALHLDAASVQVWAEYAWILATHPDPAIRDGRRALELVQAALKRFGEDERLVVQARVAALAELGRFDEAIAILSVVRGTLAGDDARFLDGWIEQFRRHEALRIPPAFR